MYLDSEDQDLLAVSFDENNALEWEQWELPPVHQGLLRSAEMLLTWHQWLQHFIRDFSFHSLEAIWEPRPESQAITSHRRQADHPEGPQRTEKHEEDEKKHRSAGHGHRRWRKETETLQGPLWGGLASSPHSGRMARVDRQVPPQGDRHPQFRWPHAEGPCAFRTPWLNVFGTLPNWRTTIWRGGSWRWCGRRGRGLFTLWASQVVLVVKNPPAGAGDIRDAGLIPGSGRSPGGGHGIPLQYSCQNPHWQRSLVSYSPYGCRESDTTEVTGSKPGLAWHPNAVSWAAVEAVRASPRSPWPAEHTDVHPLARGRMSDRPACKTGRWDLLFCLAWRSVKEGSECCVFVCVECGLSYLFSENLSILRVAVRERKLLLQMERLDPAPGIGAVGGRARGNGSWQAWGEGCGQEAGGQKGEACTGNRWLNQDPGGPEVLAKALGETSV